MAQRAKLAKAFKAMKSLGFTQKIVRPILTNLLKLYEQNWKLIEEDNYRVLAESILDSEEEKEKEKAQKEEPEKHSFSEDEDEDEDEEYEPLIKRSRKDRQENQSSLLLHSSIPKAISEIENQSHGKQKIIEPSYKLHQNMDAQLNMSYPSRYHHGNRDLSHIRVEQRKEKHLIDDVESDESNSLAPLAAMEYDGDETGLYLVVSEKRMGTREKLKHTNVHKERDGPSDGDFDSEEDAIDNYQCETVLESDLLPLEPPDYVVPLEMLPPGSIPEVTGSVGNGHDFEGNHAESINHKQHFFRYLKDIAKGQEAHEISLINEINDEPNPTFNYIAKNVKYQNACVKFPLAHISEESCCSKCLEDCLCLDIPCACARETGGEFAYAPGGLVKEQFLNNCISMNHSTEKQNLVLCQDCSLESSSSNSLSGTCKGHLVRKFIKECWYKCVCSMKCGNRVVQRGIRVKLQVFMTSEGKGWGVRTLEDVPKGSFICEYVGEVVTNTELYKRNMHSTGDKHTYTVLLDADWSSEGILKDAEALYLDATAYGNVARFINHRCFGANLLDIPVEIETPDHHYYHIAFFAARKINAFEELTWDYGIYFNDHTHPVQAFQCHCGSKFCRDKKSTKI